jgi:hypothetical protein
MLSGDAGYRQARRAEPEGRGLWSHEAWSPRSTDGQAWGRVVGSHRFGAAWLSVAAAVVAVARRLLAALGTPLCTLDPANLIDFAGLGDSWRS